MEQRKLSREDRRKLKKLRQYLYGINMNYRSNKPIIFRNNDSFSFIVVWDINDNKSKEMDNETKFNNIEVDDIYILENNRHTSNEQYHTDVLQVVSKGYDVVTFKVLMSPNDTKYRVGDGRLIHRYSINFGKLKKLEDYSK